MNPPIIIEISPRKHGSATIKLEISGKLKELPDPDAVLPEGFHRMSIPTEEDGDKRVIWDSTDIEQIAEAELTFNKLICEGMVAYRVGLDGQKTADSITEFDADAEEIIFLQMPMVAGG